MKKTILYAVLLSLVSLCAGGIIGVAIERSRIEHRRHGFMEMLKEKRGYFEGKKAGGFRQMILDKLSRKLELTASQQEKVKAILEESQGKVREIRQGTFDKLIQIRKETSEKIKEVLDPAQKEKYDTIVENFKSRFGQQRGCFVK